MGVVKATQISIKMKANNENENESQNKQTSPVSHLVQRIFATITQVATPSPYDHSIACPYYAPSVPIPPIPDKGINPNYVNI